MKKLLIAACAATAFSAFAEEKSDAAAKPAEKAVEAEVADAPSAPILWGFFNYGIYSGYQLYGSIVNTEPTMQSYGEINANLSWDGTDLGYLGFGLWHNNDLTGKRNATLRRAFNEFDFNIHWQKTFWLDDDSTWGLTYRTWVCWYFYPHTGAHRPNTRTSFDWDHSLELTNPYLIPYVTWVHEYEISYGNLLVFGVKKPWQITDDFSVCPFLELVWRDNRYGWCFSNFGSDPDGSRTDAGLATLKLELDATYQICSWLSVFAKVAYCQNLDRHLRDNANFVNNPATDYCGGAAYGRYNEFCWGGVGLCVNF